MHSIAVLPNVPLQPLGPISTQYLLAGLTTFQAACQWTQALPYARNANDEDSLILFAERMGNCTTKHGAIARLAQEHDLAVYKTLGFYRLNDDIVTGVSAVLAPHGLDFIPQIHCFLTYGSHRVDLTEGNCHGKNKTIEDYDYVIDVAPDLSRAQHRAYYLRYLQQYAARWPQLATLSDAAVLNLLTECDRVLKYQCSIMAIAR